MRAGTATREQVARLRAAATLTPEQTAAVQQGKRATIDQGEYDYLDGLMRAPDGMSAAEINKTLDKYADLKGAMGDAYRIMGNPDIQAANGEHGGIGNERNRSGPAERRPEVPNGFQARFRSRCRWFR